MRDRIEATRRELLAGTAALAATSGAARAICGAPRAGRLGEAESWLALSSAALQRPRNVHTPKAPHLSLAAPELASTSPPVRAPALRTHARAADGENSRGEAAPSFRHKRSGAGTCGAGRRAVVGAPS